MSNRIFNSELAIEKQVVHLYGNFMIGGSGAVGVTKGVGIDSIVKETTVGQYTFNLTDAYDSFLHFSWGFIKDSTGSAVMAVEILTAPADLQTNFKAKTILVQFYDKAGSAVDAASGSMFSFQIIARRSSVGITY